MFPDWNSLFFHDLSPGSSVCRNSGYRYTHGWIQPPDRMNHGSGGHENPADEKDRDRWIKTIDKQSPVQVDVFPCAYRPLAFREPTSFPFHPIIARDSEPLSPLHSLLINNMWVKIFFVYLYFDASNFLLGHFFIDENVLPNFHKTPQRVENRPPWSGLSP